MQQPVALPKWDVKPLRELAQINYGRDAKPILDPYGAYPVYGTAESNRFGTSHLYDGDSVVLGRKGTIDRVQFVTGRFWIIDTAYFLSRFSECEPKWLYYVLSGLNLRSLNEATGVPSLAREVLYSLPVLTPPPREQSKIAEVLTAVDRAIAQTEALTAKQRRIKSGLMQDLLARGIDPHGNLRSEETHAFKDSPLGRIPVEWKLAKLGDVADISAGITLGKTYEGPNTAAFLYLRVANVQDGFLDLSEVKKIRLPTTQVEKYRLQNGDVLMNEGGDFDKLGRGAVWRGEIPLCLHQNHVFKVRPAKNQLLSDFLAYVSSSRIGKAYFVLASKQSTNLASINSTQLKAFAIPLPTYAEQLRIHEASSEIDKAIQVYCTQLAKLRLIRTALMQDLLTGKIRVTPLLHHAEEPARI